MDFGAEKSDSVLLLDYGVVDVAGARGGYSLTLSIPETDRNFDDKMDILEINGLQPTQQVSSGECWQRRQCSMTACICRPLLAMLILNLLAD